MALKSIEDTDLVDGSLIKHFCDTCNKDAVMKVWFAPQGMVGTCHVCKKRTMLKKMKTMWGQLISLNVPPVNQRTLKKLQ